MNDNNRRFFLKTLATPATVIPLAAVGYQNKYFIGGGSDWPTDSLGGGEKLFFNESDFVAMRERVDSYDWAKSCFDTLKNRVYGMTEITSENSREIALWYRLTGDDLKLNLLKKGFIKTFKLEKKRIQAPLFNQNSKPQRELWNVYGRSLLGYYFAWDLVKNHIIFSDIKDRMSLRLHEIRLEFIRYYEGITRIGNTHILAASVLGMLGLMTDNDEAIEKALNGPAGFKEVLASVLRDEGRFWPESYGYVWGYVLAGLLSLAECFKQNGIENLYHYVAPNGGSIKRIADTAITMSYPNGLFVPFGDLHYWSRPGIEEAPDLDVMKESGAAALENNVNLELLFKAYKDPQYAYFIGRKKERSCNISLLSWDATLTHGTPLGSYSAPSFKNNAYFEFGHAILAENEGAQYWEGKGAILDVRNGCSVQFHGHDDPFHFNLTLNGKMLYTDWSHRCDYLAPNRSRGYRNKTPLSQRSIGHNTVTVDQKGPDQQRYTYMRAWPEVEGARFSEITQQGAFKSISMEGVFWEGVTQRRTFVLHPAYLIDVFECLSEVEHTYDYVLHNFGELQIDPNIKTSSYDRLNQDYQLSPLDDLADPSAMTLWLRPGHKGHVDTDWVASFTEKNEKRVQLHVAAEEGTTVFTSNTPLSVDKNGWEATPEDLQKVTRPVLIVRRTAKNTRFVVVHQLQGFDQSFDVKFEGDGMHISQGGSSHRFQINHGRVVTKRVI